MKRLKSFITKKKSPHQSEEVDSAAPYPSSATGVSSITKRILWQESEANADREESSLFLKQSSEEQWQTILAHYKKEDPSYAKELTSLSPAIHRLMQKAAAVDNIREQSEKHWQTCQSEKQHHPGSKHQKRKKTPDIISTDRENITLSQSPDDFFFTTQEIVQEEEQDVDKVDKPQQEEVITEIDSICTLSPQEVEALSLAQKRAQLLYTLEKLQRLSQAGGFMYEAHPQLLMTKTSYELAETLYPESYLLSDQMLHDECIISPNILKKKIYLLISEAETLISEFNEKKQRYHHRAHSHAKKLHQKVHLLLLKQKINILISSQKITIRELEVNKCLQTRQQKIKKWNEIKEDIIDEFLRLSFINDREAFSFEENVMFLGIEDNTDTLTSLKKTRGILSQRQQENSVKTLELLIEESIENNKKEVTDKKEAIKHIQNIIEAMGTVTDKKIILMRDCETTPNPRFISKISEMTQSQMHYFETEGVSFDENSEITSTLDQTMTLVEKEDNLKKSIEKVANQRMIKEAKAILSQELILCHSYLNMDTELSSIKKSIEDGTQDNLNTIKHIEDTQQSSLIQLQIMLQKEKILFSPHSIHALKKEIHSYETQLKTELKRLGKLLEQTKTYDPRKIQDKVRKIENKLKKYQLSPTRKQEIQEQLMAFENSIEDTCYGRDSVEKDRQEIQELLSAHHEVLKIAKKLSIE